MTNLTKVETNSGVEVYIDNTTGESFTSVSGYARMANLGQSAISNRVARLRTHHGLELKTAEVLTAAGLRPITLLPENVIAEWLFKDNPSMALDMLKLGVRKFLHTMAGFKPESDAPIQKLPTTKELALMVLAAEEKAERLAAEVDSLVETVVKLEPKAQVFDDFISSDGLTTLEDFAKDLGIKSVGRNAVFKFFRDNKYIGQNNRPYQSFVNNGWFSVRESSIDIGDYTKVQYQPLLTRKGIAKFTPLFVKTFRD